MSTCTALLMPIIPTKPNMAFAIIAVAADHLLAKLLHALQLGFRHPTTNLELDFEQALPPDMLEVLARLRA